MVLLISLVTVRKLSTVRKVAAEKSKLTRCSIAQF